ncbi:AraC family transcriptional regulator [Pedococcus sp. 5OH_020]|uniref:AraC family transcriptional regulator n=1 Tax=Pedococcus sp. 5OH_020 TaxID=2989814 RepID=UPI0022E9FECC|nr:AraC family transcriptional regulator [Pedococcus sp. 5OH_020]
MLPPVDRYTAASLDAPSGRLLALRQEVVDTGVHWHDFYELVFVVSGTATHTVGGTTRSLSRGSAFMLTPADFHRVVADPHDPLVCHNIVIQPTTLEACLAEALPAGQPWPSWVTDDLVVAEADFERLWRETNQPRWGSPVLAGSLLRCILVEFARRCPDATPGTIPRVSATDTALAAAVTYLEHHFREPLTLAEVAARAHLSANYFSECFTSLVGVSFQSYLQRLRLRFAESLLTSTTLSVTEVAAAAGFNTPSHFGRAYRKWYGVAPSHTRSPVRASSVVAARPRREGTRGAA